MTDVNPNNPNTDYTRFVMVESNGLTTLGQSMFQHSTESFVYAMLTAEARTRWVIVGQGAKGLQTQEVFRKLVQDTVVQNDNTSLITSIREAIDDTNVVLNTTIVPGVILVPSRMIILDK